MKSKKKAPMRELYHILEKRDTAQKRNRRRLQTILLAAGCIFVLSGCQLALENENGNQGQDKFCGVLVTTQEQTDAYRRQMEREGQTEPIISGDLTSGFEDLWVADGGYLIEAQPDEEKSYVFPGLEEASLIGVFHKEDEEGDYGYFTANGAFWDVHFNSSTTDEGDHNSMEGTVYMDQGESVIVYMNRMYQRPDGSVYTVLNDSPGFWNSGQTSTGEVYSQSVQEEYTQNLWGKKENTGTKVTVHVAVERQTVSACVKEWSEEDVLLRESPVSRGQQEFLLLEDTAYVIVEEEREGGARERGLYTWDDQAAENGGLSHSFFYRNSCGLLEAEHISFLKP